MAKSKFQRDDHVIGQKGDVRGVHGDVDDVKDHFGDPAVKVSWKNGRTTTVPEDMIKGTGACRSARGCPQG